MNELLEWLKQQNGGVATYIGLQQRASRLAAEQPEHAALFQLLSYVSGRFASSYDGMPLPVDVANIAFARIRELVEKAVRMADQTAEERLRLLNEIAQADLG
jgi:hypothetical protein